MEDKLKIKCHTEPINKYKIHKERITVRGQIPNRKAREVKDHFQISLRIS